MVRALDSATQGAVRDRARGVLPRNFVLFTITEGITVTRYGFTDFGEDVAVNVVVNGSGDVENHTFYGDNAPIQSMDPIALKIGLSIDTTQIKLNPLHPIVKDMARGHEVGLRTARVQVFRGYLDPDSGLLVANPRSRLVGFVNGAPEMTAAVGGQSVRTIKVVSHTRELTRTNSAKRSDETYKLRSGDRFGQYAGTAGQWELWWGETKGATN
jgi:hypothetical protein